MLTGFIKNHSPKTCVSNSMHHAAKQLRFDDRVVNHTTAIMRHYDTFTTVTRPVAMSPSTSATAVPFE
jgi:hypothetical protein